MQPALNVTLIKHYTMQVLGKSVADALSYYNEADTVETRRYVLYFDRFFDMLNTRHLKEGYQKKKPYT